MMSAKLLACLVAFATLVPWATNQSVPVDLDPKVYPFVYKTEFQTGNLQISMAMSVSNHYFIGPSYAYNPGNRTGVLVTSQQGVVYPVFSSSVTTDFKFAVLKTCKKLTGPMYSLKSASFNKLLTNITNAEHLFFVAGSTALKSFPMTVLSLADCTTYANASFAAERLCIAADPTANCSIWENDASSARGVVAINKQIHGTRHILSCNQTTKLMSGTSEFLRIDYNLSAIYEDIPVIFERD